MNVDGVDSDALELMKSGSINVRFLFDKDVNAKKCIELIVYAEFDGVTKNSFSIETCTTFIKMDTCQLTHTIQQDHIMSYIFLLVFPRDTVNPES